MNNAETNRLLQRISAGDNNAFAELYERTSRGVYAFLFSYLKNKADTEDAMQTVYLKIKMNISQYKHGTNGRAWIFQIAKNHALNELKKNKRTESIEGMDFPSGGFEHGTVMDAMSRALSEDEQQIIILHVLWGYKHREIADLLGCPTGTVTSKYKRAIAKMKNALKEDE